MCLWSKDGKMLRAENDIVGYKIFRLSYSYYGGKIRTEVKTSPYMGYEFINWENGAKYKSGMFGLEMPRKTQFGYPFAYGFHSYANEKDADLNDWNGKTSIEYIMAKVIIKKGTLYYKGVDDTGSECYCSESIELSLD